MVLPRKKADLQNYNYKFYYIVTLSIINSNKKINFILCLKLIKFFLKYFFYFKLLLSKKNINK